MLSFFFSFFPLIGLLEPLVPFIHWGAKGGNWQESGDIWEKGVVNGGVEGEGGGMGEEKGVWDLGGREKGLADGEGELGVESGW